MSELITNNFAISKPHPGVNLKTAADYYVSTAPEIDTTTLENAINHLQSYVDEKSQSNVSMAPQLAMPSVKVSGVENDTSSLKELLDALKLAKTNNAIDADSLLARLTKVIDNASIDPVELERSWEAFEQANTNLSGAQAEVEKVILMLIKFQAIAEPTQDEIDKITKAANDAFTNVNVAMAELIVSVKTVLISANQEHLNLVAQVKTNLDSLGYVLLQIQKNMKKSKIELIQNQSELYKTQQQDLSALLIEKAEKIKETQDKRATFVEAMKYILMSLAVVLAFASGGTMGPIVGMASAALLVLDLATEGKASEVLMTPVTAVLVPMIEGIVTGISKVLEAAGCSKILSLVFGILVAVVTVVAAVAVAGSVAGKILGKLVDKFAPLVQKVFEKIGEAATRLLARSPLLKGIFETISNVMSTVVNFVQKIWNKVIEAVQTVINPILDALAFVFNAIVDMIRPVMKFFSDLLTSLGEALGPGGKFLDDLLETIGKWLEPVFTKIKDALKAVDKAMDDALDWLFDGGHLDDALKSAISKLDEWAPADKALAILAQQQLKEVAKKEASDSAAYLITLKSVQSFATFGGMSTESGLTVASAKAEQDEKNLQADSTLINTEHDIVTRQIETTTDAWGKNLPVEDNFFKLVTSMVQSRQQSVSTMYRNLAA